MRTLRRIAQIFFFLFFTYLFFSASYPLKSVIPVDLFLRADPLIAISSILSSRAFINTFLPALILILLTIPLGRVFCGWVCPLGTLLDGISYVSKSKIGKSITKLRTLKYYVLIFLLIGVLFSSQLVWFLDPISLLSRSFTLSILPMANFFLAEAFGIWFRMDVFQDFLLKLQGFFSSTVLPIQLTFFRFSGWVFLILLAIISLEFLSRRFWCRNLCPLGALYAFFSKFQLLRRRVSEKCTLCGDCTEVCKMDAIEGDFKSTKDTECILCWNCIKDCPAEVTSINFSGERRNLKFDLSRRGFLSSFVAGLFSVGILKTSYQDQNNRMGLVRPPGSRPEPEFLDRCIRCHKCIRICSTSGRFLQPSFLEGGLESFLTPVGVARYGYCEYNCTMCTEVCPTQAIHPLDLETKKKTVIGLAFIDRSRCIPWYKNEKCIVCEEQCPTPKKAIELREEKVVHFDGTERMVLRPYVIEELCIGCGICETKCPVEGESAIKVTPQNEQRWVD